MIAFARGTDTSRRRSDATRATIDPINPINPINWFPREARSQLRQGPHRRNLGAAALMLRFAIASLLATLAAPAPPIEISARSRTLQPGELVVLSIIVPARTDTVRVRAFHHDAAAYRVGDGMWTALVGIDLDVKPGTYAVTADTDTEAGPLHATSDLVVKPHAFPTRRLTVNEAFV